MTSSVIKAGPRFRLQKNGLNGCTDQWQTVAEFQTITSAIRYFNRSGAWEPGAPAALSWRIEEVS